jgi:hypothetical protein
MSGSAKVNCGDGQNTYADNSKSPLPLPKRENPRDKTGPNQEESDHKEHRFFEWTKLL